MYATLLLQCLAVQQVHLDHAWLVDSQIAITAISILVPGLIVASKITF